MSPTTARAWLSALEASHVISPLEPWHSNASKRIIKTPKLYFNDTGRGALFESFAFGQIARVVSWELRSGRLFSRYTHRLE